MLRNSALTASKLHSINKACAKAKRGTHTDTLAIKPGVAVVTGNPELASPAADMAQMRDLHTSRSGGEAPAGTHTL